VHTWPVTVGETSTPLWAQVLGDLRARLDAGEFTDRFPGDHELVGHYGVSRHTVREAVRRLQAEGRLTRQRGRGTFVSPPTIEQPLGALYSLFQSIEAQGLSQDSEVRRLDVRGDERAAAMLGLASDDTVVYLERVRLADGQPFAWDCSWLPARIAHPLLEADFHHTALYEELHRLCDVRLSGGWERIRPVLPDSHQRELLGIDGTEAAFAIERVTFAGPAPVEWRRSVIRFTFVARWDRSGAATTFEAR
jgi:GntR family transcriptional regulator